MTLDPTNMPFGGVVPYLGQDAQTIPSSSMEEESLASVGGVDMQVKAESMLLAEYNYAATVAYQAREDSANLFNLYLLSVGVLATGLGVLVSAATHTARLQVTLLAMLGLLIFTLLSFAFFVRYFELGQDEREARIALGAIKEYYIERLKRASQDIERAFRWRLRPHRSGAYSIGLASSGGSSLIIMVIALLGALSFGGAVGEIRQLWSIINNQPVSYSAEISLGGHGIPFIWEILFGLALLGAHIAFYALAIRRRNQRHLAEARQEASKFQLPRLGQRRTERA